MVNIAETRHALLAGALQHPGTWQESVMALMSTVGVTAGGTQERLLAWINGQLGTSHGNLGEAQDAYAQHLGVSGWHALLDIVPADADLRVTFDFANQLYRRWNGAVARIYDLAGFPNLSIARPSPAGGWVAGPSGPEFAQFAANEPRLVIDPVTGEELGLLVEPESTRLTPHFATPFDDWTPFFGAAVTPFVGSYHGIFHNGARVASGGNANDFLVLEDAPLLNQDQPYGCQFFYLPGSSAGLELEIRRFVGGNAVQVAGPPGALAVTFDTTINAVAAGLVTHLRQEVLPSGIHWVRFTFTPNSTTEHRPDVGPNSAVVGDDVIFLGGGIETNPIATTPILDQPDQANVTRSADRPDLTGLEDIAPGGGPLTYVVRGRAPYALEGSAQIFDHQTNFDDARVVASLSAAPDEVAVLVASGGATSALLNGPISLGADFEIAARVEDDLHVLYLDAVKLENDLAGVAPVEPQGTLSLGYYQLVGDRQLNGTIKSIDVFGAGKDNVFLTQETTDPDTLHLEGDSYMAGAYFTGLGVKIAALAGRPGAFNAVGGNTFQNIHDRFVANVTLHQLTTIIWDGRANAYGSVAAMLGLIDNMLTFVDPWRLILLPPVRYVQESAAYNDDMTAIFEGIKARGIRTFDPFDVLAPLNDGSPADLDAIKPENRHIPPSLFPFPDDDLHLSETAIDAIAAKIVSLL